MPAATAAARRQADWRRDRTFYTVMGMAAAVSVGVGFSPTFYLRSRFTPTPLPAYLVVHGFLFTAWILLFVVQTALVAAHRTDIHRRLGWGGAALGGSMVIAGVMAGILSGRRGLAAGEEGWLTFLTTPLSAMLVFALLVTAAVRYRRQIETHKRLMLLATISILDAAVARWPSETLATSSTAQYLVIDSFIVAAALYDVASRRRVDRVYLWGGVLIVAEQALRNIVGRTAAWHAIAGAILR